MSSTALFPVAKSDDPTPKHERLRAYLLAEMTAGRLKPGDALPTELDLVESTGLSRNTVRQALAGLERGGLIDRVRGRGTFVHESAGERLRTGLQLLGLVIPESRAGYYPSLQRGFRAAASDVRSQVIVCDTGNDPLRQADGLLQLMDAPVAGVAIVPTTDPVTPPHQVRALQRKNIPIVFCHRRVEGVQAPLVTFPAQEVGRLAGRALADRGHRRVAFFTRRRTGLAPLYEQGLRAALREAGGDLPPECVRDIPSGTPANRHEDVMRENLEAVMAVRRPPTAIFCGFDSEAELLYLLLPRLGLQIPEDVSLIGFGGTWREGAILRRLTSVVVDEERLGKAAVDLLDEMRRGARPIDDTTDIVLPLALSDGETLGPAAR
jgi:DNA-binding LacI/PurR family transcriptional regulator